MASGPVMTMMMVMTTSRTVADIKAHLAACLKEVEAGEEVVITRRGKPVAVLVSAAEWGRRSGASAGGLLSLVGSMGEDGDVFADEIERMVRDRSSPRPLPDFDDME